MTPTDNDWLHDLTTQASTAVMDTIIEHWQPDGKTIEDFRLELFRVLMGSLMTAFFYGKDPQLFNSGSSKTLPIVLWFAGLMEKKLTQNRDKGDAEGWRKDQPQQLFFRAEQELTELQGAMDGLFSERLKPEAVLHECADVANFAMMIADVVNLQKPPEGGSSAQ